MLIRDYYIIFPFTRLKNRCPGSFRTQWAGRCTVDLTKMMIVIRDVFIRIVLYKDGYVINMGDIMFRIAFNKRNVPG